jgi:small GTP-binding protein
MDNNDNEKIIPVKLIIIGSVNVGKTSLLTRYATGKFQQILKSTSNASFIVKNKIVNNQNYEIKLWDTAGQERYRSLTKIFIKEAKIALLVYSIDDLNSFKDLNMWLNIVREVNNNQIILGIAANKADLYKEAKVTDEEGKKYAKEIGAEWRSTSSLLDDCGIDELVDVLFNKYIQAKSLKKAGSFSTQDTIVLNNKKNNDNEKSSCCIGKKDKKKLKSKTMKISSISENILENNDKYNEDEDF